MFYTCKKNSDEVKKIVIELKTKNTRLSEYFQKHACLLENSRNRQINTPNTHIHDYSRSLYKL